MQNGWKNIKNNNMGYKFDDKCLDKAYEDEKLFVLMARDFTAPFVVIEWIKQNLTRQPPEKLKEALDCALEMVSKNMEFQNRKALEEVAKENKEDRDDLPF